MHNTSTTTIVSDIDFVKSILPEHYQLKESFLKGSIHCKSRIGIRDGDDEDREQWEYIVLAIKKHFSSRFQEIYHHVCVFHKDFTIYLKKKIP